MKMKTLKKFGMILGAVLLGALLSTTAFAEEIELEEESQEEVVTEESADIVIAPAPASDALNLERDTIVSNVFIAGNSLSGLTLDEAIDVCETPIENVMKTKFVVQSKTSPDEYNYSTSYRDLGITWDNSEVSDTLKANVLSGNLLTRYKKAKDVQAEPVIVDLHFNMDAAAVANKYATELADWDCDPVEAVPGISGGEVVLATEGHSGYKFDFTSCANQLYNDLVSLNIEDAEKYILTPDENLVEPEMTNERVLGFSVIGSYSTEYGEPKTEIKKNRQQNLIQSTSNMNGYRWAPGANCSALAMYGSVTYEGGYRNAPTISEGVHRDSVGGGICQTTTTLYNAVLLAELPVTYRHNHSMMVTYVQPSMDAMVYAAGNQDFTFENNTGDYIYIVSWVNTDNLTCNVAIIGKEIHGPGHEVEYISVVDAVAPANVVIQEDASLPVGNSHTRKAYLTDPDNGPSSALNSHLIRRIKENGEVVSEEVLHHDYYKPSTATFVVSPDLRVYVTTDGSLDDCYSRIHQEWINGTSTGVNVSAMSPADRAAFNSSMNAALQAKGLSWPDPGDQLSVDGTIMIPNTYAPEESKKEESSSSSETTAPTQPETQPTTPETPGEGENSEGGEGSGE